RSQRKELRTMARHLGLRLRDLAGLLELDPEGRLGVLIRLNALPHYHNRLNVVELACALQGIGEASGPSASFPGSSGTTRG
ncbi:MAG: hypothetical protein KDB95_15020, partial [Flavobacteriales bacterium]|nr:hypothetical protein [Flavobacteriales bacterium]